MNFRKLIRHLSANKANENFATIVTFTGGMGAQIISAAIYFSLRNAGSPVYADLSYFDKPESVAVVGKTEDCSHWSWQLEPFGLSTTSFDTPPDPTKLNFNMLQDGSQKLELGLKSLAQSGVQKFFEIPVGVGDVLPGGFADGFLCIHVRRGDYVNVASHMVADGDFIGLARKFSGLINSVVVISDSPIEQDFQNAVSLYFKCASFLDNTDAYTAHRIMRNARILICSNSQFSLIAAVLNPDALVLIPKMWFGDSDRHIEAPIHAQCSYQIMK